MRSIDFIEEDAQGKSEVETLEYRIRPCFTTDAKHSFQN